MSVTPALEGCCRALEITRYARDQHGVPIETVLDPTWERLERELSTMHRFEKPILWLMQDPKVADANVMPICGGEGAYFVQVMTAESEVLTAWTPNGSSERIEVWTSDQGFSTEARYTWALEHALIMARWYFEHGTPHPDYVWE